MLFHPFTLNNLFIRKCLAFVPHCIFISFNCRQLCKNNKGILNGEYMHSDCWTPRQDFGETLEVADMMTRLIHPSTPLNFLLENQDGAKTIVSDMIAYHFFSFKTLHFTLTFIVILFLKWLQKLYELVVRHFLACVSKPAVGAETTVEIDIAGELFSACGRVILEVRFLSRAMHIFLS